MRGYGIQNNTTKDYLTLKGRQRWTPAAACAEAYQYPETARAVLRATAPRYERDRRALRVVRVVNR